MRALPLHLRKTNLERLLARRPEGIFINPFERGDIGPDLFRHACLTGLEGLVSKHRERAIAAALPALPYPHGHGNTRPRAAESDLRLLRLIVPTGAHLTQVASFAARNAAQLCVFYAASRLDCSTILLTASKLFS